MSQCLKYFYMKDLSKMWPEFLIVSSQSSLEMRKCRAGPSISHHVGDFLGPRAGGRVDRARVHA